MKANENGFTKLPNNLMESIPKIKATATQYELLLIIIRMTFGFHRNTHRLTLSYLEVATNRNKRDIQRALKDLEERRIIFQNTSHNDRYISFNSNTDEWKTKSGKCKRREENPNRVIAQ
jgi:phage replication O-like protein O